MIAVSDPKTEAVIINGGIGDRYSNSLPTGYPKIHKSMILIDGKPLIHHNIQELRKNGISNIACVVNPVDIQEKVIDFLKTEGIRLIYLQLDSKKEKQSDAGFTTCYSFYHIRQSVADRVLLLYSDILHKKIIQDLLQERNLGNSRKSGITAVVDPDFEVENYSKDRVKYHGRMLADLAMSKKQRCIDRILEFIEIYEIQGFPEKDLETSFKELRQKYVVREIVGIFDVGSDEIPKFCDIYEYGPDNVHVPLLADFTLPLRLKNLDEKVGFYALKLGTLMDFMQRDPRYGVSIKPFEINRPGHFWQEFDFFPDIDLGTQKYEQYKASNSQKQR